MRKKNFSGILSGKGYYIALILCAVAIGITGYVYYRNTNEDPQLKDPVSNTNPQLQQDDDMQVVATDGNDEQVSQQDPDTQTGGKPDKIVKPVAGETLSPYSMEMLTYNQTTRDWRVHDGMDIAAEAGTQVCAAAAGKVYTVCKDETMGMTVVVDHGGGYVTEYCSLAEDVAVAPGDTVTAGQCIGYVGDTALLESAVGDHVHFRVTCNGKLIDPAEFLEQE
ncbi:MAG: M23 family metallopeptidase [Oscillospiraceae bacterium]|nr:M23 family metallopeptidase [Oscillospiraceae bacterium]